MSFSFFSATQKSPGGIGIDRLIMKLTVAPTIRDVVLFRLQKRKE